MLGFVLPVMIHKSVSNNIDVDIYLFSIVFMSQRLEAKDLRRMNRNESP